MTADPTELAETRALLRRERRLYAELARQADRLVEAVLRPSPRPSYDAELSGVSEDEHLQRVRTKEAVRVEFFLAHHPKVRRRPVRRSRG